ncbi:MAG: MFS transporter [Candidatus Thorarchaeota archaeon]|nr:MFS transporter [Candidatus Thorarchaeota archaeon]
MNNSGDDTEFEKEVLRELYTPRERLGLSGNLWRLALVTGLAQFSMSLWSWEFSIYLNSLVEPWQLGLTYSIGTLAVLLGYLLSGIVADLIGRRRTMAIAFGPIIAGLITLSIFPIWPFLIAEYALIMLGWSFILIMARAIPADVITQQGSKDSARKFTMVLMPAFLVDGISPMAGAFMLEMGFVPSNLHFIAALGAVVAFLGTLAFLRETLDLKVIEKAKAGPVISLRNLGRNFWHLAGGMLAFYLFFNIALTYFGLLITVDWNISETIYGYTWSAFSITSVILMHTVSGLADRNIKKALAVGVICNAGIIGAFSILSGVPSLLLLNILWAFPVILWMGAERSLVVGGVNEETKGRALGTYQFLMSTTNIFAPNIGALVWDLTGSLRVLWAFCSIGAFSASFLTLAGLRKMDIELVSTPKE